MRISECFRHLVSDFREKAVQKHQNQAVVSRALAGVGRPPDYFIYDLLCLIALCWPVFMPGAA